MRQPDYRFAFCYKKPIFKLSAICILLLAAFFVANAQAQTETLSGVRSAAAPSPLIERPLSPLPDADALPPGQTIEKLVHRGDVIEIDVLGSVEFDWRGKLDDAGFLNGLPNLDNPVSGLCRTEDEIALEIAAAYQKFLRQPEVVVRTLDRSTRETAVLFGAVRTPQRFQIERPVNLNELLILSGGITDNASGEITIFRPANVACRAIGKTIEESNVLKLKLTDLIAGKPESNPLVQAGDTITIEAAAPIFVTGGVVAPQRILFRAGLTVSRAVASAGGLSQSANNTKIVIFRREKDSAATKIIEVAFEKTFKNPSDDVLLAPFDIVEVAERRRAKENRVPHGAALDSPPINTAQLPLRIIK